MGWLGARGLLGEKEGTTRSSSSKNEGWMARLRKRLWAELSPKLRHRKRTIAFSILRANAAMDGSLLLGWAYAMSRATRMGHAVVASHQVTLSVWLVVALVLEGAGVAAQVLMAREWRG